MKKVGVVGYGWVGKSMVKLFPDAVTCDLNEPSEKPRNFTRRIEDLVECELNFICVPTPQGKDGRCKVSEVEKVARQLHDANKDSVLVIRSTVQIGTTDRLAKELPHQVVFQPEYLGETEQHPYLDPRMRAFVVLGGEEEARKKVADLYKSVYNAEVHYHFADAKTAELCKYMENSFLAMKVIFSNEFYDIAKALDVDYNVLRELWLADYRIGRSHTDVYPDKRGFSGKCLPKDTAALVYSAEQAGVEPKLMKAVREINKKKYGNE